MRHNQQIYLAFFFSCLLACSHKPSSEQSKPQIAPPAPWGSERNPNAAPARLADLETKPNQEVFWGGSEEAEIPVFLKMGEEVRQVIQRQTQELRGQESEQRAFHAKGHACLRGEMHLNPKRSEWTKKGIFADKYEGKNWKFWARFSNGVGWVQKDTDLDIRGLALKLLDVPGEKYLKDESSTQDFIMISTPTGFGRDSREFMDFAQANSKRKGTAGLLTTSGYSTIHTASMAPVVRGAVSTLRGIDSLSLINYFSGTPYRMGDEVAMKFRVVPGPCLTYKTPIVAKSKDKMWKFREDLYARAKKGFCMGFEVQQQGVNFGRNPIEDASVNWNTDFERVAELEFIPQDYTDEEKEGVQKMCDRMAFNPWHAIAEHRPLGNQNRARRWVYDASRDNRHGGSTGDHIESPIKGWNFYSTNE